MACGVLQSFCGKCSNLGWKCSFCNVSKFLVADMLFFAGDTEIIFLE